MCIYTQSFFAYMEVSSFVQKRRIDVYLNVYVCVHVIYIYTEFLCIYGGLCFCTKETY